MNVPPLDSLNSSSCTARSIQIHYPDFYNYLIETYPDDLKFTERLCWYYSGLTSHPTCPMCGNKTSFMNFRTGYRKYCSNKCMSADSEIISKRSATCMDRYGTDNAGKIESAKAKARKTCMERYGVIAPMQSDNIRLKSIATCRKKYGADTYSASEQGIQHKKDIAGVTVSKMKSTRHRNFLKTHQDVIDYDDEKFTMRCPDPGCTKCTERIFTISKDLYYSRKVLGANLCTICNPVSSNTNTRPELFVQEILDECGVEYKTADRTVLNGRELDVYIPKYQIGIECNGSYWHSSLYKSPDYHFTKYQQCSQSGIQLLNIWDDWIVHKPEIVKSIIKSKLGIYDLRIGARQCDIRDVNSVDCKSFLDNNHIQGSCNSSVRLGLYHNGELMSIMMFSKSRSLMMDKKNTGWELTRFCNRCGVQVMGGASRLLNHFITKYHPDSITSYSSHDISDGGLYKILGFSKVNTTKSSYWYIHKTTLRRYHRFSFRKSVLVSAGYDPGLTESQIMSQSDFLKIYDSGQDCWRLVLK